MKSIFSKRQKTHDNGYQVDINVNGIEYYLFYCTSHDTEHTQNLLSALTDSALQNATLIVNETG